MINMLPRITVALEGELELLSMFKTSFQREINKYHKQYKMMLIPTSMGVGLVGMSLNKRASSSQDENDDNAPMQKRFSVLDDGQLIAMREYSELSGHLLKAKELYASFQRLRKRHLLLNGPALRSFHSEMIDADYRRLNNGLTFVSLFIILSQLPSKPDIDMLTVFYSGFNYANIRSGEWYNREVLKVYEHADFDFRTLFTLQTAGFRVPLVVSVKDPLHMSYSYRVFHNTMRDVYIPSTRYESQSIGLDDLNLSEVKPVMLEPSKVRHTEVLTNGAPMNNDVHVGGLDAVKDAEKVYEEYE